MCARYDSPLRHETTLGLKALSYFKYKKQSIALFFKNLILLASRFKANIDRFRTIE